ncbi:hypothetical protein MN0502_31140 [Arthrobacter sp. MN05-02]|nr:hypothetical protein MN0502_31140 [Arthrobacter sp. MN05-02]
MNDDVEPYHRIPDRTAPDPGPDDAPAARARHLVDDWARLIHATLCPEQALPLPRPVQIATGIIMGNQRCTVHQAHALLLRAACARQVPAGRVAEDIISNTRDPVRPGTRGTPF